MASIEALRTLERQATPGPWEVRDGAPHDVLTSWEEGRRGKLIIAEHAGPDGALIAATRNALPALLDVAHAAAAIRENPAGKNEHRRLHAALKRLDAAEALHPNGQ